MEEQQHLTIGELAEAAGVTQRTIRYYTTEGLLPPPDTRGRYALYGEEHVLRLRLIARLKEAYLPLGEIKTRMAHLSAAQVMELLDEHAQAPAPRSSAADYLAHVLASSTAPVGLLQTPRAASEPKHADAHIMAETRQAYTPGTARHEAPASAGPPHMPLGYATPASPAPQAAPARGLLKRFAPQQTLQADAPARAEETWQRWTLAPGVELHVREPLAPDLRERVVRLFEQARKLFDE